MHQQLIFQEFRNFYYSFIIFSWRITKLVGINRDTSVDIVMQCEDVAFVMKIPGQGIKVIFFVGEADVKIIGKYISDFIKSFKAAIVINDSFGASKVCA